MHRRQWLMASLAQRLAPSWAWACTVGLAPSAFADGAAQAQAQRSAEAWLALLDAGTAAASWQQAGLAFRSALSAEAWSRAVAAVRGPLGALKQRALRSVQEAGSLPGAPDGRYVVLQFDAVYAHKAAALETVTTVLEPDGAWRVVGYFIK